MIPCCIIASNLLRIHILTEAVHLVSLRCFLRQTAAAAAASGVAAYSKHNSPSVEIKEKNTSDPPTGLHALSLSASVHDSLLSKPWL